MEKKFSYKGSSFRDLGIKGLALFAMAAGLACSGSDYDSTGPARVRYPSSITATVATSCTTAPPEGYTGPRYNLTATWQATGTWKASFVNVGSGKVVATTGTDASQSKSSVIVDEKTKQVTDDCAFVKGDIAYAILYPAGDTPVAADADLTPTVTIP